MAEPNTLFTKQNMPSSVPPETEIRTTLSTESGQETAKIQHVFLDDKSGGAPTLGLPTDAAKETKQDTLAALVSTAAKQQPPSTTQANYNLTLTDADTSYSQALPANTRQFRFRCRTLFDVRFSLEDGKVATPTAPYLTLPSGGDYEANNVNLTSATLYLASSEAGVIVEIETWQ